MPTTNATRLSAPTGRAQGDPLRGERWDRREITFDGEGLVDYPGSRGRSNCLNTAMAPFAPDSSSIHCVPMTPLDSKPSPSR
jgi:hypothetical protein